ncbi:MAG: AMP-binding protein [Armatimonadota bacterium]
MIYTETLAALIEAASTQYSSRTSHIWRPGLRALRFTYGDIGRMSRRAAALLQRRGVGEGDRVVIWAANSPYWVAAFWGCQLLGAVAVPMMVQNTPDFVDRIAGFTEAKVILATSSRGHDFGAVPVEHLEEVLGPQGFQGEEYTPGRVSPDSVAQILFTSGTTGEPKGVVLRHRNILANLRGVAELGILRPDDHFMSYLPLAHVFEQIVSLFLATSAGVPVTQAASLAGSHIRLCMEEDRPTVMTSVPEFLKRAVQRIESRAEATGRLERLHRLYKLAPRLPMALRRRLASQILQRFGGRLRLVVSGGSALDPEVGRKWEALGVMVLQGYGATETSPVVSVNRPRGRKVESVGPPLPGVEVRIAEDGEILVRGPNVADGYYNRPEETAKRFRDGWYFTDDLGELDADGHLHIRGRKKFLIVTPAGENIYPEDLEAELNSEPEVADSAVLAIAPDGRFEVHAVLLPPPGSSIPDPRSVVERVNSRLQPHQRIQGVSVWEGEDFPRTVTRKVRKDEVRAWLLGRQTGEASAPRLTVAGALERAVAQAAGISPEQVLPEYRLEADLKLDSLGRVTLAGIIEEEMGVILDEGRLGPSTTVAELKELVAGERGREDRYEFNPRPLSPKARFWRFLLQRLLAFPLIDIFAPMRVTGTERLRGLEGAVLFMPNHISPADGILLKAIPEPWRSRLAIAAATDVLYEKPGLKRFAGLLELLANIYPFSREGQIRSALQYTGRLMDRGWSILVFPEGRISMDGHLQEFRTGAGLMAVELNAPVVPMAVKGTDRVIPPDADRPMLPRRSPVHVRFGHPVHFAPGTDYASAARRIRNEIAALLKEMEQDG